MKKSVKIWLWTSLSLILLGLIAFVVVMTANGWDFRKLSTVKMQTNTYEVAQDFDKIEMDLDTIDVQVVKATDGVNKVVCFEEEKQAHTVTVEDGTLRLQKTDERKWYEYLAINFYTPKMTVYLADTECEGMKITSTTGDVLLAQGLTFGSAEITVSTGDVEVRSSVTGALKIKTSTGDIDVKNTTVGALSVETTTGEVELSQLVVSGDVMIKVSTGDTEISTLSCKTFTSTGSTGDIEMEYVTVEENVSIKRSTGDVELEDCEAGELTIETSTGDVTCRFISEKNVIANSNTGSIRVPQTQSGGRCTITTSTGDIRVTIR